MRERSAMPKRTTEVSLRGEHLATYVVGWHESDPAPTDDWLRENALKCAWDEGLLPESEIEAAEVALGAPPPAAT